MKSGQATSALVASFFFIIASAFIFPPQAYGSSVFYVSISFAAASILLSYWHAGRGKAKAFLGLAFKKRDLPRLLVHGLLLAALCIGLSWAVSGAFYFLGILDTDPVLQKVALLPLPVLLLSFTLAPLGEEMFFRGFLFRFSESLFGSVFSGRNNAWIASALLASMLFSLLHWGYGSIAEIAVTFIVGIALCASVKKSGSLIPAITAHAIFNFLSVVSVTLF